MRRLLYVFVFIILLAASHGFEYRLGVNESLVVEGKTVTLLTLNDNQVLLNISGEDKIPPLTLNKPKSVGNDILIVTSIFYSNDNESFAMIDFCNKSVEVCNNLDDDCDGRIDDGISRDCGSNISTGICMTGVQKCVNGEWGYCENQVLPQNEICNNLDDDCDGLIDENITRPCGNSPLIGKCKNGIQTCTNGTWSNCEGYVYPEAEKCNNIDDDCNGKIDENLVQNCGVSDIGVCKFGKEVCSNGGWETCIGAVNPSKELCDSLDNDCDGVIDNNCESPGFFSAIKNWFSKLFG